MCQYKCSKHQQRCDEMLDTCTNIMNEFKFKSSKKNETFPFKKHQNMMTGWILTEVLSNNRGSLICIL